METMPTLTQTTAKLTASKGKNIGNNRDKTYEGKVF